MQTNLFTRPFTNLISLQRTLVFKRLSHIMSTDTKYGYSKRNTLIEMAVKRKKNVFQPFSPKYVTETFACRKLHLKKKCMKC